MASGPRFDKINSERSMLVIDGWLMLDTDSTRIKRGQSPEPLLSSVTFGYETSLPVDNDTDRRNDKVDDK